MKPDYKNWIPKGMLFSLIAGTMLSLALLLVFGVFGIGVSGKLRIVLSVVFGIAFVVCAKYTVWCVYAYRSFSYDGERKLSKQLIDGTAEQITLPEGGVGLDIGCGSGALTIACAKRNPQGKMVGIDRWGKEYASFSLPLCEKNAAAAGVKNASFRRGNAVKLDFPDESFDAVTSNYVYTIIVHPRCVNFITEISNYTWAEDKFGAKINVPIDDFNHLMDAMRYGLEDMLVGPAFSFD